MKNKVLKISTVTNLALLAIPFLAFAQQQTQYFGAIADMLDDVIGIIAQLQYVAFAVAFIYFFWGMGQFIRSAGEPKAREEGRQRMIWGVIAIAVMLSIYGLVRFLQTAFGVTNNSTIVIPVA